MNLLEILKRAIGMDDPPVAQPVMAQLTIISTDRRATESPSSRAQD